MIINPEKFQVIAVKKNAKMKYSYPFNINDLTINSKNNVKLFGIETDNKLSFEQHISTTCNKASNQLNIIIGRIQKFMGFKGKKFLLIVLYTQTLIIVLLFDIFAYLNLYMKSKYKKKEAALDYYTTPLLVIMLNS